MKQVWFCLFVCVCLTGIANAQNITGGGTANTVPVFTGNTTIGDSDIVDINGKVGIGANNPSAKLVVFDNDQSPTDGLTPTAVFGITTSNLPFSTGVRGNVDSGTAIGVVGVNNGLDANSGGGGVEGLTFTTIGFTTAVRGTAAGINGNSAAIFGEQFSPDGIAGQFINRAGGNILVGAVGQNPDKNLFRVDGSGRVFADGGFRPSGADFAESMEVTGDRSKYAAGDLLVIDPTANRRLALAHQPYSTLVAGIYSTKPGLLGSTHEIEEPDSTSEIPLAVVGIVPCKVTAENGPIQVGDLLVTSSTAGHAMKGSDLRKMLGAVVGKALEPLAEGKGVIQVLVTLQ